MLRRRGLRRGLRRRDCGNRRMLRVACLVGLGGGQGGKTETGDKKCNVCGIEGGDGCGGAGGGVASDCGAGCGSASLAVSTDACPPSSASPGSVGGGGGGGGGASKSDGGDGAGEQSHTAAYLVLLLRGTLAATAAVGIGLVAVGIARGIGGRRR